MFLSMFGAFAELPAWADDTVHGVLQDVTVVNVVRLAVILKTRRSVI